MVDLSLKSASMGNPPKRSRERMYHGLVHNTIHVWTITLSEGDCDTKLEKELPPEDRQRAERFHFSEDRRKWIKSRWAMRFILSKYLDVNPRQLQFVYGVCGKPAVNSLYHDPLLDFNVAHSGELALLAVTYGASIGVDIEYVRDVPDVLKIANSFFCRQEANELALLPSKFRSRAFLRCWTCKEACLKANGMGLSMPLNHFRISFSVGDAVQPGVTLGSSDTTSELVLYPFTPNAGYVAAVAYDSNAICTTRNVVLLNFEFH